MKKFPLFILTAACVVVSALNLSGKGIVTIDRVGGDLMVTGDDAANSISLREVRSNRWEIVGSSGTDVVLGSIGPLPSTAAASAAAPVARVELTVTGNIIISMQGGNDRVSVRSGIVNGRLSFTMGEGNDSVTISGVEIGDYLFYAGGNGNDSLTIQNVSIPIASSLSLIDLNAGNDQVNIDRLDCAGLSLFMRDGNDVVSMRQSHFSFLVVNGDLENFGADRVTLSSVSANAANISMGNSNDTLALIRTQLLSSIGTADGGPGAGDLFLSLGSTPLQTINFETVLQFPF